MITRLSDFVLRLTLPAGAMGHEIRVDLLREAEDLANHHSSTRVALWRLLEAIKLAVHFLGRRLGWRPDP